MTPGARAAAAIAALDAIVAGAPAEQVLTRWGRSARYAGSGDRAAVRDLVYDALRKRRSAGAAGGGSDGRALILGLLRLSGDSAGTLFTGEGHAPSPLTAEEAGHQTGPLTDAERLDCPDWLLPLVRDSLGIAAEPALLALRERATVFLRARGDRAAAAASLADEGIATRPHPNVSTALEVIANARKIQSSESYGKGLVELQDASSQGAILDLPLRPGLRVLDYCAGGGGKALALAARERLEIVAHDADPRRMADLPDRAARAGAEIAIARPGELSGDFDLVVVDAPCSGSGTWRRTPDAKWRLTPDRLDDLCRLQRRIVAEAAARVRPGGRLAYMTCSLLSTENEDIVPHALAGPCAGWDALPPRRWQPDGAGDGFFLAQLVRPGAAPV
ncbi:RsmB/NOP family class I SAM-dependent RNA methyltransferase [Wenxinia marina]|uniref:tRNA and rRNA cytosine-C5-methylase n=1 Tax=Wenxinia marina DSM 24838 TaxID=1123501 RepID=A0A0D0QA69_9RHOB|nr:RsmB/NOP family class I SAM-dependent RNA methyltransferase [Wenxinia marina]KIQ67903.1 tRNA and rRNA cytosine-C5-methylase [Wenxinia marina DSM 24838]GGL74205.1 SAM-dependent methyltransferase [Wenxinia marina]